MEGSSEESITKAQGFFLYPMYLSAITDTKLFSVIQQWLKFLNGGIS